MRNKVITLKTERPNKRKSILKKIAGTLAALMITVAIGTAGVHGYEYYRMGQANILPGTCLIDGKKSGLLIMKISGLKHNKYQVVGLVMFALPFEKEISYRELNTQIKEGLLKETPCSKKQ